VPGMVVLGDAVAALREPTVADAGPGCVPRVATIWRLCSASAPLLAIAPTVARASTTALTRSDMLTARLRCATRSSCRQRRQTVVPGRRS
jgi:hypothetical protein